MLHRWPALYVLATPTGMVSFAPTWRASPHMTWDSPIAITFAYQDSAYSMRLVAESLAETSANGLWLMVPKMSRAEDQGIAIHHLFRYRDAIHRAMGWADGPLER
jgi:hypothetical protein